MALVLKRPRFQIIGYRNGSRRWAVPGGGRVYGWNWENLKTLLEPPRQSFAQWLIGD